MSKEIREMINKINNFKQSINEEQVVVYRYIDDEYSKEYKSIEYFAVNKDYAKPFGENEYKFIIDTNKANILNLTHWNKLYTQKSGRGSLIGYYPENAHMWAKKEMNVNDSKNWKFEQGLFVIGSESIQTKYQKQLEAFGKVFDNTQVQKFLHELDTCDAIYGEDAGYPNEFVFAVINKNILTHI